VPGDRVVNLRRGDLICGNGGKRGHGRSLQECFLCKRLTTDESMVATPCLPAACLVHPDDGMRPVLEERLQHDRRAR
jgi:hypothetical protein